jgi:hypothetical protein
MPGCRYAAAMITCAWILPATVPSPWRVAIASTKYSPCALPSLRVARLGSPQVRVVAGNARSLAFAGFEALGVKRTNVLLEPGTPFVPRHRRHVELAVLPAHVPVGGARFGNVHARQRAEAKHLDAVFDDGFRLGGCQRS